MALTADYHAHSNYSDGRPLPSMIAAAERAGLEAIGFTDHCNVSPREPLRLSKREFGFNLDLTYERRREALETLGERFAVTVHDGVELDYDPRDEDAIATFLADADFEYAVGSVHALDGTTIFDEGHFTAKSEREVEALVDEYYERLVALIESELFEVVGHVDALERTPSLRGYTTADHRVAVADALATSSTLPEINAGAIGGYGEFHPAPTFLDALVERGLRFVPGTDSHRPGEIDERAAALEDRFAAAGVEPATPFDG
ncbi:PHP domain-containing protein [Salinilacihabitans rarus]|uniref:PHP domain-containing protein n=1 Tax=Salinilacihabitans rarus TaxID=2961596 RepID=UPI002114BEDC|nr:PHP domain-containing protein [Salinilacihabitans rarus]